MDETEFHALSIIPLQELLEFVEGLEEKSKIEGEMEVGVLSVTMPDGREFVINKHTPSRQIWVSSPYSGAGYFEYDGAVWAPKRAPAAEGRELIGFIKAEINSHL